MAEKPNKKEGRSFKDFLKDAPAAADVLGDDSVPLTGVVAKSDTEGKFVLATQDGQTLELNADDVTDYEVVQEQGPQKLVTLHVSAKALNAATTVGAAGAAGLRTLVTDVFTRKELTKDPIFDTRKELIKDPIKEIIKDPPQDPVTWVENVGTIQENIDPTGGLGGVDPAGFEGGAGLTPFIMATPHHASQAAVAMQPGAAQVGAGGAALTLKELPGDVTRKEMIKDPIFDTRKELTKDPIIDPITWVEQIGTQVEQVFDPGQVVTNPADPAAFGGLAGGLGGGQEAGVAAAAAGSQLTAYVSESPYTTYVADRMTRKELIFDTRKELIWDTRKEVIETYVEGGGTIQEGPGGIDPGSIWNLPGMMF